LIFESTAVKGWAFWTPAAAFTIVRADAEIGRVDLTTRPKGGEAKISLRGRSFECRIHITGKAHWTHVPSRWVMYSADAALHGATWESARTFLIDGEEGLEPLRLSLGGPTTIERAGDRARVGEIRGLKRLLLPKYRPPQVVLDTSLDLPETFQVLLLWIVVQSDLRNSD
jgi:hypothetical protein